MMQTRTSIRILLCFLLSLLATPAMAVEFAIVGPRAAGMGGAGVAVTTDSLATYWNPAGLAMTQTVDIRAQASAQGIDRLGVRKTLNDIEDLDKNNPANIGRAQDLANRINQPGASLSAIGSAGLYVKGHLGEHALGFNVSDVATSGAFLTRPVTVGGGGPITIDGQMAFHGLEARQAAFSYAYAFADKTFALGITGKLIQGAAYTGTATINGNDIKLSDNFGKAKLSTAFGIDVGAIYRPSSWLRFGVVAKDLNQPEFDAPDGTKFKLNPQVRGGIAINPYSSLTLTGDVDATSNKTLVPGQKSQVLSLGAEQTILSEFLSLRIGALKNMQDATSPFTPTAGFGLRIFAFRMDFGGGYDFRERGVLASGSVSLTF
ncbi:MAG: conjugal transfer protein TraF [Nitrospirae bacterium]|nr:conjugal transfer protein TraF [Nitrospirota bacterium]MBU6480450.1 conjugal transfer protein TraF [Nitrospirota bacterium]MDE3039731.1 conjugal transfer protein TraF [Nitrospirota bacterium]MDE3048780.1 conjugal transfer protein TraF [Nitrospirota bacterium]